eukprot:349831-Chlamydomonas_euryale.AAC.4
MPGIHSWPPPPALALALAAREWLLRPCNRANGPGGPGGGGAPAAVGASPVDAATATAPRPCRDKWPKAARGDPPSTPTAAPGRAPVSVPAASASAPAAHPGRLCIARPLLAELERVVLPLGTRRPPTAPGDVDSCATSWCVTPAHPAALDVISISGSVPESVSGCATVPCGRRPARPRPRLP